MPGDALITVDPVKRELQIEAPYDAAFIAAFKKLIPGRDRRWDPDAKVWHCHKMFLRQVQELCEEYYDEVHVEEMNSGKVSGRQSGPDLPPAAPLVEQDAIRAYANMIRWLSDDGLAAVRAIAIADRVEIADHQSISIIEDAYHRVQAWRASRETTG